MAAKNTQRPLVVRLAIGIVLLPLYALYGVVMLLSGPGKLARKIRVFRLGLASGLCCPHGHVNPTTGRFECGRCHATYHGWIGKCPVCGAGAGWTPCTTCGVAVPLPWERP